MSVQTTTHREAADLVHKASQLLLHSPTLQAGELLKRAAELLENEHAENIRLQQALSQEISHRATLEMKLNTEINIRQEAERQINELRDALKRERSQAEKELQLLAAHVASERDEKGHLQHQLSSEMVQRQAAERRLADIESTLQRERHGTTTIAEELQRTKSDWTRETQLLSQQLAHEQSEHQRIESDNSRLGSRIHDLERQLAEFQDALAHEREQNNKILTDMHNERAKFSHIDSEMERLKSQLQAANQELSWQQDTHSRELQSNAEEVENLREQLRMWRQKRLEFEAETDKIGSTYISKKLPASLPPSSTYPSLIANPPTPRTTTTYQNIYTTHSKKVPNQSPQVQAALDRLASAISDTDRKLALDALARALSQSPGSPSESPVYRENQL